MLITDSLITENTTWHYVEPALRSDRNSTLTLINTTVSENESGLSVDGEATLIHSTIAHNGIPAQEFSSSRGLSVGRNSNVTLINSLIAEDRLGPDCAGTGTVTFKGLNFVGDRGCGAVENNQLTGDPQLGPLADNGGPTWTHALLPNSPRD